ncbi:hypothetical protein ACP70R_010937 [Stipagrostis hirtigluma subsp. patula]
MTIEVKIQLLVFCLVFTMCTVYQAWGEQDYYEKKDFFEHRCMKFIEKSSNYHPPNESCCHAVREVNMVRICRMISAMDEETIDVRRVVWVALACNNPAPAGNKCGSLTVRQPSWVPPPPRGIYESSRDDNQAPNDLS